MKVRHKDNNVDTHNNNTHNQLVTPKRLLIFVGKLHELDYCRLRLAPAKIKITYEIKIQTQLNPVQICIA